MGEGAITLNGSVLYYPENVGDVLGWVFFFNFVWVGVGGGVGLSGVCFGCFSFPHWCF